MTENRATKRAVCKMRCAFLLGAMLAGGCSTKPAAKLPIGAPPAATAKPTASANLAEPWRKDVPAPSAETPWTYPAPFVATLPNGLTIYVAKRALGPVALSIVVRHGGADVPAEKSGLASLAAQMMVEATKTKDHYLLSETAESLGSTLAGDANRDSIRLTLDTLPEDMERGIALLAETLVAPAFDTNDFQRLRKQHLDDLVAERQNPSRLASLVGLRAALGEWLGSPVGGRQATVRKLTIADVREWHRRYVLPSESALFVVGPVEPAAVLASAERTLRKFPAKKAAFERVEPAPAPSDGTVYVVDRPGSVQSAVFVVQGYPKRGEPGYAARQVLDNVVGGQFTSRINQNLREQHAYTYGARSATIATRHFGLFTISTNVETDVTAAALREIVKELHDLRGNGAPRPISQTEVDRAKTGVVQSLGAHLEDGHRLLLDQEQLFVYALAPTYFRDLLTEVRGLSQQGVVAETERLTPDRLVHVLVGDASRIVPQLEKAGLKATTPPATWLD